MGSFFDDNITDTDLIELGIGKKPHRNKIVKEIKKMLLPQHKLPFIDDVPPPPPPPQSQKNKVRAVPPPPSKMEFDIQRKRQQSRTVYVTKDLPENAKRYRNFSVYDDDKKQQYDEYIARMNKKKKKKKKKKKTKKKKKKMEKMNNEIT